MRMKFKVWASASVAAILIAAAAICVAWHYGTPTRIALVNFSGFRLARMLEANDSKFQWIEAVPWDTAADPAALRKFDVVIVQGMGLAVAGDQEERFRALGASGVPVHVVGANRPGTGFGNFSPKNASLAERYYRAGTLENYRNFYRFLRRRIDGKLLFSPVPEPPAEVPEDAYFHRSSESVLTSFPEYMAYLKRTGHFREGAPLAALVIPGNGGTWRASKGYLSDALRVLEEAGFNTVGISGGAKRIEMLRAASPDVVLLFPHGRLSDADSEEAAAWLREHNVPFLCPIRVYRRYDEYLEDPKGLSGGMASQSVAIPEVDGGVRPHLVAALYPDGRGLEDFALIPGRMEKLARHAMRLVRLKKLENSKKKIAVIFYKSPGKNAMHAAGLEVGATLLSLLRHLQSQGYDTGELPETPEALEALVQRYASRFGVYAQGAAAKFAKDGATLIDPEEYNRWRAADFPASLIAEQDRQHGAPPDRNFHAVVDGCDRQLLGVLRFGNIALLPQPAAGYGSDPNKIVHGVPLAPPHTYSAAYLWIDHAFQADAMIHIGTHGSLEFTPWRQLGLLDTDWPDALTGSIPHFYYYVVNNIGEALAAKRRSYAVLVSYLTAPFMTAGLSGTPAELDEKIERIENAENPALAAEYTATAVRLAKQLDLGNTLKLSPEFEAGKPTAEDLEKIHLHLHEIEDSKVTRGSYVLGRPYSASEAAETAALMLRDELAARRFRRDANAGHVAEKQRDDLLFYQKHYLTPAQTQIEQLFAGEAAAESFDFPEVMRTAAETRENLLRSADAEVAAVLNAFAGGFTLPSPGGSPLLNPLVVPSGRNLYGIDPERMPTQESWAVGRRLGEALIQARCKATGEYPRKIAFTLWCGEFMRTQGSNLAEILFLLGVEPVWDSRGRVGDLRLIPAAELKRPRIDVAVQTSGQFRGCAPSRMILIDRAVRLAAAADAAEAAPNFVRENSREAEKAMLDAGLPPETARDLATARIFGRINNGFGTGVREQVEDSGRWENSGELADRYFLNMGTLYTEKHWNVHEPAALRAALINTDAVIQPRSSATTGALSSDDVYQFMGGLNLAVKTVTGREPGAYFNDLRNPGQFRVQNAEEAVMVEARSTMLNPKWISELQKEGASGAGVFAKTIRNTFAWAALKPELISNHLWDEYCAVYVKDRENLGMDRYFEEKNPYAQQELTAVMLEAARKGFWRADEATLRELASRHAELIEKFEAECDNFVCDNDKLRDFIASRLDAETAAVYQQALRSVQTASGDSETVEGMTLKEERRDDPERAPSPVRRLFPVALLVLASAAVIAFGRRRRRIAENGEGSD